MCVRYILIVFLKAMRCLITNLLVIIILISITILIKTMYLSFTAKSKRICTWYRLHANCRMRGWNINVPIYLVEDQMWTKNNLANRILRQEGRNYMGMHATIMFYLCWNSFGPNVSSIPLKLDIYTQGWSRVFP